MKIKQEVAEMHTNDPIVMNARKQAFKDYVRQQLDTDYQGCPFFVTRLATSGTDTEVVTTSFTFAEPLNSRIFTMAASPLHRLSLFSACIKYLAFLHSREPEGSLIWAIGAQDRAGNGTPMVLSNDCPAGVYLVPAKWHLTETELTQPVKRLFGEELAQWKQVAALTSGIPLQSASSVMSQLPQILAGYSETQAPFEGAETACYSLSLWIQARPEKTCLHMRFDSRRVDAELTSLLMDRLTLLLNSMVFEPNSPLASMPWIPEQEREQIAALSAPVPAQPLRYKNVAQAMTASMRDRAETRFLEAGDQTVNFKQLERYTDNLLTDPDLPQWESLGDCVLIVGAKGVETTLAAMACIRIGKPFCLQSYSAPERQLLDIIELHSTKVVLLQESCGEMAEFFRTQGCQVVMLPYYVPDAPAKSTYRTEMSALAALLRKGEAVNPDDPLCVVMTSGSEGKPKGCINTHQALLNLSAEKQTLYRTAGSRVASVANHTFDYFILECVQCLTQDIVLVMPPEEVRTDAEKCVKFLRESHIDLLFTTTVLAEYIMEQGDIPNLRQLYFGGESLRTFQKNNYELFNVYGPSETGVITTYLSLVRNDQKITIGKPLGGCQCVVVFPDSLEPCPIGVTGELLIGGIGVGMGYINRPDLTEQMFIDLDSEWLKGKYYRSGDLCYWNVQGEIEIEGRRDRQLKVNGFRVELDAIEKNILDLPTVAQAAVIGIEDQRGHAHLGAFIVTTDSGVTEQNIREALLSRMPAYMVPSQVILVAELSLTRNGKLDRQGLKQAFSKAMSGKIVRPDGATQEWLAACWARYLELEVDALSVDKSFFSFGGHSLRAARVLAEIQHEFGQVVSLLEFFQNDTIEALAKTIDARRTGGDSMVTESFSSLLEAAPQLAVGGRGPLSAQEIRLYAQYRLHPESLAYILALEIPLSHDLSTDVVKQTLQVLIDRHDILRTRYRIDSEGIPYAEILPSLSVDRVLIDDRSQWLQRRTQAFELGEAPLLRGCLQEMNTEHAGLQLQIHHILVDKPSLEILQREFQQLLAHESLAPVALSYRHYALALADARQHLVWTQAETFWANYLEGLEFDPFGHGAVDAGSKVKTLSWHLSAADMAAVKRLCGAVNVTPAMLFLSVWGLTVAREGSSNAFSISVANAFRPKNALETVGMFVSLSPCAFRFDQPTETFDRFIKKLADEQWRAVDQLFFPVEEAFALLSRDPRMFGRNPLLNVAYSYLDAGENEALDAEDLLLEAHGPLNLTVSHRTQGIQNTQSCRLTLEYQIAAFTDSQIEAIVTGYQEILRQILRHVPSTLQIDDLIVSADIVKKAFRPVQRRASYRQIDAMLINGFLTLTDRPAVMDEKGVVTWGEFAALTAAYTQVLNQGTIRRALILGRQGRQLQAFLAACFLTHTTYLALETGTPEERINEVIRHAEPDLVIKCGSEIGAQLQDDSLIEPVSINWRGFHSMKSADDNPIGWVLYSSGTTGKPKGICVAAHTAAQYVDSLVNKLGLKQQLQATQQGLRIVQQFSPSFDGYLEEVLLSWALQGTSVVVDRYSLLDERKARAFLLHYRPDVISAAPALFSAWNRMPALAPLPKICISGGDFLAAGDISQLLERTQIWNSYGPTETCIAVSMVNCAQLASGAALSIGEPFDHAAFAVINQDGGRLRVGQWGELVIYGDFERHGYLNDPALTARKFGRDAQGTFFRTGDLAMAGKNGLFYLKGRMDDSCKVRGNFIGLGELENRAGQHPDVIAAGAAVAFAGTPEACLVLAVEGKENMQSDLQQHLARHYPRSHLPSAIFPVASLPRTETGKLDRQRIVALFLEWREYTYQTQEEQAATMGEGLQKLITCWRECLGYKGALTQDSDFFLVSGSSLNAVRLANQLETRFGVTFSPVDVFRNATLGEQWSLINARQGAHDTMPVKLLQERFLNSDDPNIAKLILLPPALGGLIELQTLADKLAGRVTVSVLTTEPRAVENLSVQEFKQALLNALTLHIKAQDIHPSRSLWLGGYSLGAEMLVALLAQQSESSPHFSQYIDKLVFLDPNLRTNVFEGDELYAEFVAFFRDVNRLAFDCAGIDADMDVETLRRQFPSLHQEWRYYQLQHQILENKTFHERILALPSENLPVTMFFSDDADEAGIDGLTQKMKGCCTVRRKSGDHVEFVKQLTSDDFIDLEQGKTLCVQK
ncbi:AMP-binding protein [Xenorhabdus bovienii]|uniref:Putative Nonribosomal peptide synthetase n=1 Tax=Xenorhabdus bovienii str. feltiae Moldova TaxID=1398200 RepID=A0A077NXQ2_XENBV|nr:AMP-binding protein [Xenorhabdus bovienii]CDH03268.1 putative Nonribosomal peptide synthetase [Xenorhabdus bovienii str. feltiae Moldova]